jgi:hypothetical protein
MPNTRLVRGRIVDSNGNELFPFFYRTRLSKVDHGDSFIEKCSHCGDTYIASKHQEHVKICSNLLSKKWLEVFLQRHKVVPGVGMFD